MRDRIVDLTLEPGYNIDEKRLLSELEIGRTPLREALNRLISEGLIESRGNRGLRVTPLNIINTRELFEAYILSERTVASVLVFRDTDLIDELRRIEEAYEARAGELDFLGVTSSNAEFHNRLAMATQNSFLTRYSWQLTNLARRVSYFIFRDEYGHSEEFGEAQVPLFERAISEHLKIIKAIEDRDRETLIDVMTSHAAYFRERLSQLIGRSPGIDVDMTDIKKG